MIEQIGHGALAAGAQAGKPHDTAGVAVAFFPFLARNGVFVPMYLYLIVGGHLSSGQWLVVSGQFAEPLVLRKLGGHSSGNRIFPQPLYPLEPSLAPVEEIGAGQFFVQMAWQISPARIAHDREVLGPTPGGNPPIRRAFSGTGPIDRQGEFGRPWRVAVCQ